MRGRGVPGRRVGFAAASASGSGCAGVGVAGPAPAPASEIRAGTPSHTACRPRWDRSIRRPRTRPPADPTLAHRAPARRGGGRRRDPRASASEVPGDGRAGVGDPDQNLFPHGVSPAPGIDRSDARAPTRRPIRHRRTRDGMRRCAGRGRRRDARAPASEAPGNDRAGVGGFGRRPRGRRRFGPSTPPSRRVTRPGIDRSDARAPDRRSIRRGRTSGSIGPTPSPGAHVGRSIRHRRPPVPQPNGRARGNRRDPTDPGVSPGRSAGGRRGSGACGCAWPGARPPWCRRAAPRGWRRARRARARGCWGPRSSRCASPAASW